MTPVVVSARPRQLRGWLLPAIALATLLVLTGLPAGRATAAPLQAPVLQAALAPYQVLVFSKTAGFRHDSIPAGVTAIQQLGAANGFTVVATEDAAAFTDANLATFATVVFLSTTADVLNATQQGAFERYIEAGGGYVGVHAAADTEYDWAWYGGLVGAYFNQHPTPQQATVKVEDPAHPSTAGLPALWVRNDEWYNFRTNPRSQVHVLASLDERSYAPGTGAMGADHPISWCQDYDGGRAWYTGLGHANETFADAGFRSHLLGGIQSTAGAVPSDCGASKPIGFEKVSLDSNTSNPMELDIAPDGRVFYIERDGRVQIIRPTTGSTVTAIDLDVFNGNEDGLLGLRLDPGFSTNKWVYLYYSPNTGAARNQISRFTVEGDSISLSSERVVLQIPTQRNTCCHMGGSMALDSAGNLYLATGDNTNPFESDGYNPIDERAGRQDYDAQRTAGNTNDLRGKIVRIKPQADGTYTVPSGNLFPAGTANTRAEIFAMGFRNPFRIGVDQKTNTLYVADYGPDAGAANANRGPEGTVEWNIVRAGNYGWPYCTGANYAYRDWTFPSGPAGAAFNCAAIVNNSPNNTGLQNLPPAIGATVDYDYGGNPLFPEIGGGGAPMGGPVYRYNPALVSDRKWPAYYDGKALFGEWNQNKMYTFQVSSDGKSLVDINSLLATMTFKRPMDFEFGPDGAMYLIEWGSGFGGNNDDSGIYRIDYISGGRAPIAVAAGTPTTGGVPLTVTFSSAGSRDPDGQAITYAWNFGDGGTSTAANPTHTYTTAGNFNAQLVVTDTEGRSAVANVPVTVGNTAPTVTLTIPPDGGFFTWGDTVRYAVTVTDPEDGTINCNRVTVNYSLGHDEHAHTLLTNTGCTGTFQTTSESGHGADANIFGVIEAVYTDNGGSGGSGAQTGRSIRVLQPKRKQAEFFSATGRAPGAIGGGDPGVQREATTDSAGGLQNIGFIEDGDYWTVAPANLTGITGIGFRVASASTGGRIEVRTGAANGPLVATATVPVTGGWQTFTDISTTLSGQSGGSGPLYFVAKNPTGGTGQGSLFNVNWMDFAGRGIADSSQLAVSPGSLAFGSVPVGSTTAAQTVTLTNPGTAAANVATIATTGAFSQTNNCPASLAAGASCLISVRFTPTAAGAQNATLSVANSTTPSPLTVSLSGTGTTSTTNLALGALMTASSTNPGFPASNANDDNTSTYWESSGAFPQWLQADLRASAQVGSITLKLPPPANWATRTQTLSVQGSTDANTWTTVAASATYTFNPATGNTVTVPLTSSSLRYLRVTVTANSGWPAAQIAEFQIFGTTAPPLSATLSPSPSTVSFGNQTQGTTSAARAVVISNTGTATASLSSVGVTGVFGQTNTCGTTLAAGATCTVNVTFAPTALGATSGSLTVTSNATNPTLTVALTGTGTAAGTATLSPSPSTVAFGNQTQGTTSTARAVTITNSGTVSANLSAVGVTGAFAQTNTCGTTLAAGATCTVNVTFSPTALGATSGSLTVTSNASNPTLTVSLTGTGTSSGQTPTNLALNRPVTANSSGLAAANAVDSDVNSYWESPNNAFPQSFTVDLGGTAALSSIAMRVPPAWGARSQTLSVLTSVDGSTYTTIVNSATYQFPAAGTASITLPGSSNARYVRLTFTANTGWPAAQLSDLQIMGIGGGGGGTDLALNKSVTASSSTQTYTPGQSVDTDPSTYWESANGFPQTLTVDLGASTSVRSVTLRLPPSSTWNTRTQTVSILGSVNNTTYSTIVAAAGYTFDPGTGNTATITFTATSTRYLRLSFTANTGGFGAQLSTVSIFA